MINDDTIKLLKECNAGVKTAVTSIDEVLPHTEDKKLKSLLTTSKGVHEKIGNTTHELLNDYHDNEKDPNPMVKAMSWMKINMKLAVDSSDNEVADLIFDGCNMGVKSLYRYLNQYQNADEKTKALTRDLIQEKENLRKELSAYL